MEAFELEAEKRTATGRAENKRLRKAGRVPAIIYGGEGEPVMVSLAHNELVQRLDNEAFFSHVIKIKVGRKTEQTVLRALQRHPAKPFVEHADFLRVVAGEKLRMGVPLHFVDVETCPGVVDGGGILQHNLTEVEIECLPSNIPEFIDVFCGRLQLNDAVHLSDLALPEGVQIVSLLGEDADQNNLTVVSVQAPRVAAEAEDEEAETALEGEADEQEDSESGEGADESGSND